MRARRWPARLPAACCRMAIRASAPAQRTTGLDPATRCRCRWRLPAGAASVPHLARMAPVPGPGAIAAPACRCESRRACGRRSAVLRSRAAMLILARCSMCARRWPTRCRLATMARGSALRTTGQDPATRCNCRRWPPTGVPCAPVPARAVHAPCPGAVTVPAWRWRSWGACGR